jgi:hypothetical protein
MTAQGKTRFGFAWTAACFVASTFLAVSAGGQTAADPFAPARKAPKTSSSAASPPDSERPTTVSASVLVDQPPSASSGRDPFEAVVTVNKTSNASNKASTVTVRVLLLDDALTQAMEKNPAILAARAKVASAEAELRNIQFETANRAVACWNEIKIQSAAAEFAKAELKRAEQLAQSHTISKAELDAIRKAAIEADAKLSRTQSEIRFLIGEMPPSVSGTVAPGPAGGPPTSGISPSRPPLQVPHGPMLEKVRQGLNSMTQFDLADTPLQEAVNYLKELHRVEIQIDEGALAEGNLKPEMPITSKLAGLPLIAALQALEDRLYKERVIFVVRDYGMLVTTVKRAQEAGYMPIAEFMRLQPGPEHVEMYRGPVPTETKPTKVHRPSRPNAQEPPRDPF